ncbi:GNAT family N-acetyltransferase [Paenibacillus xerothermodurans]|uniref:GNAT family N-acetyltransferase n=1 Tax=Paenibacillus xerothermodurans TaxID=1977292 RepID=A0A2W1N985_PAEXE|nr:GNAT family N-acetyltransferase [Paenibacillus xerothermodurans]PZE21199.1 GNAT family N-acetyltransferase [Paenibacillus xerothermodurans]
MIRKRIPQHDDKVIWGLVVKLLLPYARKSQPDVRVRLTDIRKRLRPCLTLVSVGGGQRSTGFISLRQNRQSMHIDMLAVDPKYQGKGVGSQLMEAAERSAVRAGCNKIYVWVDEANVPAQRFYQQKQFEPIQYHAVIRCYLLMKRM